MTGRDLDENKKAPPLYGLLLGGGKSSRMGLDKMTLQYGKKMESERCFELLANFCQKVFVSNRKDQAEMTGHKGFPQIHDMNEELGPMGGIWSAMNSCKDAAWLVLGCDMPYVDKSVISYIVSHRNPHKLATAFLNPQSALPEPLCTIYEPSCYELFKTSIEKGNLSPQNILSNSEIELLNIKECNFLKSINTEEEYKKAKTVKI